MNPRRVLAVDFGSKRVGLAITDPLGLTAQPLPFLVYKDRKEFLKGLRAVAAEKSAEKIVLGLPKSMDGSLGPKALECRNLAGQIERDLGIPVALYDESFTTREAESLLVEKMNVSREKRKLVKDSLAACLLLESYLRAHPGP